MVKDDIAKILSDITGMSKDYSRRTLDIILKSVVESLVNGDEVSLSGFGKFCVVQNNERNGHNPQNGEELVIPAKKRVRFRPSAGLKRAVN